MSTEPVFITFCELYRREAIAYDAVGILDAAIKNGGATRQGIHAGSAKIKDISSVIHGKLTFDADRRVTHPQQTRIVAKNKQFAAWSGKS